MWLCNVVRLLRRVVVYCSQVVETCGMNFIATPVFYWMVLTY